MDYKCTIERFLDDVKDHQINIIKNDGIHRHLRFKRKDSGTYWFELITWPNHLCISGDMGTYVFSRIEDMFNFFRMSEHDWNFKKDRLLNINADYWEEKLLSIDSRTGVSKFDSELFEEKIKEIYNDHIENNPDENAEKLWEEIDDQIISYSNEHEHEVYNIVNSFCSSSGFEFTDFFEYDLHTYTFHYIWNLYAIVWGIKKYDEEIIKTSNSK